MIHDSLTCRSLLILVGVVEQPRAVTRKEATVAGLTVELGFSIGIHVAAGMVTPSKTSTQEEQPRRGRCSEGECGFHLLNRILPYGGKTVFFV